MAIIPKIPVKALLIFISGLIVGVCLSTFGIIKVFDSESVSEALNQPTQTSTVNNKVQIDKLKKSEEVVVKFEPNTTQEPIQVIKTDTCFSKSDFKKLKPSTLRRMDRDMKRD